LATPRLIAGSGALDDRYRQAVYESPYNPVKDPEEQKLNCQFRSAGQDWIVCEKL
jgi:hypothetical protein